MGLTALGTWDLALAASLSALNALLSLGLRLRLETSLLVASARMTGQLLAVGYLLRFVFARGSAALTASVVVAMACSATSSGSSMASVRASSARAVTARAPCPGAGGIASASTMPAAWLSRPSRFRPASAR